MARPVIDLRSDTVTSPTPEMRDAMAGAVVGDDGYGEDPTVAELEALYAELVGKQAALFVPSGVMANQIAVRILTSPGDVIVAGARQHVVLYELAASARNGAVQFQLVDDRHGVIDQADVARAIEGEAHHLPAVHAIFVENTHMASGGRFWTSSRVSSLAQQIGGLPLHMDGARLFNAAVASGEPPASLAASATTVMSCLSKGLCAPVGSLLAGPQDLIDRARIERKRLGGGMRQAGVLAAAGLVALRTMVDRLGDDHRRARALAEAVAARWPNVADDVLAQPTNLVVFPHDDGDRLLAHLDANGIAAGTIAPGVVRFVTHREIDDGDVDRVVESLQSAP
jgi:threonine aldolase